MSIKSILVFFVFSWTLVATSLANPQAPNIPVASKTDVSELMSPYRIQWNSTSKDEADSVPLGNGNTGIGLWVVENGDIMCYLARNDAISEMHRLLKLGRLRISISPNPFVSGKPFSQILDIRTGICTIRGGLKGSEVRINVLVDSDSQTVYLSGSSDQPIKVSVGLENWRSTKRILDSDELASTWVYRTGIPNGKAENYESADTILNRPNTITWYHRNAHTPVNAHYENQHINEVAKGILTDPIVNRTFGASISGADFVSSSTKSLTTRQAVQHWDIKIATHSNQTATTNQFLEELLKQSSRAPKFSQAKQRTASWWSKFWAKSFVFVNEGATLAIPSNQLPVRFGADSSGKNTYRGEFGRVTAFPRPLSELELTSLTSSSPTETTSLQGAQSALISLDGANQQKRRLDNGYLEFKNSKDWHIDRGFTIEGWIKPDSISGRIFDKITPGGSNGFLLDMQGKKLRLIAGNEIYFSSTSIEPGVWTHVAAIFNPQTGKISLFQNGKRVAGNNPSPIPQTKSAITQNYLLTRYQLACQQRSQFPAHFNGGIFTVAPEFAFYATDPRGRGWTPDYRFYGPSYWWQNTRFLYQLHLAEGNYDLMDSFYEFYFRHIPLFQAKAKAYYNAKGIFMNETLSIFGTPGMGDFGWGQKEYSEPYTRNIWQQALEFGSIALDRYDYTGDEAFLKKTIHWCDLALQFYDTRFKKDIHGKMIINPSHAVETYWNGVTNDTPSIAGLNEITQRLLSLPTKFTTQEQRDNWRRIANAIPALPKKKNADGLIVPDVAESYSPERFNYEAPDLYTVYPFRLYGLQRNQLDIEEARRAWRGMVVPGHYCWYQTGVFAARLGLSEGAKEDILFRTSPSLNLKVTQSNPQRSFRFPGFYSSPHDWCPDYDGAGNMANTLQEMLLQPAPENKILLLPAWPTEWDVKFKLYAPGKTLIECEVQKGKISKLEITPRSRGRDLIIPPNFRK